MAISISNVFFADIHHVIHTQTFFRQRWNCKSNQLSEDEGEVKQPAAMEPSKPGQVGKAFIVVLPSHLVENENSQKQIFG